jgi:hypothetical protein
MISYWTQFAKTGNPNASDDDEPLWLPYSASTDEFGSLDTTNADRRVQL